jgi:hypothetical protein
MIKPLWFRLRIWLVNRPLDLTVAITPDEYDPDNDREGYCSKAAKSTVPAHLATGGARGR